MAMQLADRIYDLTADFPSRERFALAYQMRKSAVSIPSNIVEGHRLKTPSYAHHLRIALGSHAELDTQCEIATRPIEPLHANPYALIPNPYGCPCHTLFISPFGRAEIIEAMRIFSIVNI